MTTAAIPFNRPYLSGKELQYAGEAFTHGHTAGNGEFTRRCHAFFSDRYSMNGCLLTQSCTAALEMASLLANIAPGDEVIMPAFTFVSTANAFVLRGARIVFADSRHDHPNIDADAIEGLITKRTRAIVPVHYGGCACDMGKLQELAYRYNLMLIEDAAQAVDSFYLEQPLGLFGNLAAFSFHETKNIICGEGGMLVVNDPGMRSRSEIIWEKGTNRSAFFRGEVDKYGWVDVGSSFLPSEITAAFLFAQLENLPKIQLKRRSHWDAYMKWLRPLADSGRLKVPLIPDYARHNGHIFHIVCDSLVQRTALLSWLGSQGVEAVFHYQSLHNSPYYSGLHDGRPLPESIRYSDCLLRLPMYVDLTVTEIERVCSAVIEFYR